MSFLKKMQSNALSARSGVPGVAVSSLAGFAVDKGERYLAAWGFGAVKGYYRERAMFKGIPADVLVGGAATVLGAVFTAWTGGRSAIAPHLERVGDAGVMSYLNSKGAGWGMKKAGRSVYVLDGAAPGALPAGMKKIDMLGAIPAAMGGAYLSADEIANFASKR